VAEQWVAVEHDGEVIGDVYVRASEHDADALELGYHFLSSEWGCGFATEACRALLLTVRGQRVQAPIVPGNQRSRRVATKLGMTITRQVERGGLVHDLWELNGGDV
jgi:RimJ/RimL family protein N-acetyltransferase